MKPSARALGSRIHQERCVRRGDVTSEGLREKARFVLGEMERRLGAFGAHWRDTTATQVYTVHDLYPFLGDETIRRVAAEGGLTWCFCRPPVVDLNFEMACRAISNECVVQNAQAIRGLSYFRSIACIANPGLTSAQQAGHYLAIAFDRAQAKVRGISSCGDLPHSLELPVSLFPPRPLRRRLHCVAFRLSRR
ncbi:MAG TPA: hypothetical protein VJR71_03340, partial [Pseudolabrys sp.]|nr:hypothetical protein [Pseudolabrys sp.]